MLCFGLVLRCQKKNEIETVRIHAVLFPMKMPDAILHCSIGGGLLLLAVTLIDAQWDPNHPLQGDPQWVKPRRKRTSGADEPWPPRWNPPECDPGLKGYCMLPPYYPYDEIRREIPKIGIVNGRSMAYRPYRYINLFLGVPYARPPVYERRFKVS